MNWESFYLLCFIIGIVFVFVSLVLGGAHFHLHFHVPGHVHGGGAAHGPGHGSHWGFLNPMSIAVFLAWFGATGYLLARYRHFWVFASLGVSTVVGLVGASLVLLFMTRVLLANEHALDPLDFEMVGVLAQVSSTIRSEGTGEIQFVQEGARKACAARSEVSEKLDRGEEVVVTRFERGVAYVRRWNELAEKAGILPEETNQQ